MNIFDSHDDDKFDEKDKVRLFQTVNEQPGSSHRYAKTLLATGSIALVALLVFIFVTRKSAGDEIMPSPAMRTQVYDHMQTTEKRTPTEMTFFKCDGYYWVKILAEPKPYPPSLLEEDVNQFRVKVTASGRETYNSETLPLPAKADDVPCGK